MSARLAKTSLLLAAFGAAPLEADVAIGGIEGALLDNVIAHMDLDDEPCDAPQWRVEREYQATTEEVRSALAALGFYAPTLERSLIFADDCWHATLEIRPGEPVRLRRVDVAVLGAAAQDPAFRESVAASPLAVGAPLDHGAYERLKSRWSQLARERGYAQSRLVENRIDVYPEELAADLTLRFDSGPRYRFGPIRFEQDVLTERLMRAYLPFETGDPYDNAELTELYIALNDSGYFERIDIEQQPPDPATQEIPVTIALTPASRRLITYGAGFSTDTGPRLRLGRTNRRWNDRGHQFGVTAQLSTVISEVTGNYRFPFGDPRNEWINFDAGAKRENTETAESDSLQVGARRVREVRNDWARAQMLTLLVEDFQVADQSSRARLLMPGIDWTRIRADNTLRPTRGDRLDFEIRGASDALGSDTSFVQVIADGKWIWPLGREGRALVRSQIGTTWKDQLTELPASVRFFAGGDNSVRGYEFDTLGPVNAAGEVIGGSSLITASFEYELPLRGRWSLALFVDSGNAFESSNFERKSGVGIGGRWQSPLGPIRVDLAHPLDHPTDNLRLHINLGPDL
jgi:translocation and assembly module TamA